MTNCFVIGSTRVLISTTARLIDAGVRVEGVLSEDPAVARWAAERGVPVLDPRGDLVALLTECPVDFLFSTVNFRILKADVLALPRVAAINFHDGPLPTYSGSHVAAWALYRGERKHAATWHVMAPEVDAGPVLLERWFPVREHSTALSLTYEAAEAGIALFDELVPHIVAGTLPEPVDTAGRARGFFMRHDRMPGLIHAGTDAAEADRISKAHDFGAFPNPLGIPALVTDQGAVLTGQVRAVPREEKRADTIAVSASESALKVATPEADLVFSDFTDIEGATITGRAAAQRLGISPGQKMPTASPELITAIADELAALRRHEPWWRKRLAALRPAPVPAADFSAATSHYSRYELAYSPASDAEREVFVQAFLTVLAEHMGADEFDFGFSTTALRQRHEATHGLAADRVPVRFSVGGDLSAGLAEAAAKRGYATDLAVRMGLAQRPIGADGPTFTRVMVLQRGPDEEASAERDTEFALLSLSAGPPVVCVRETAMSGDEALDFADRVEELALDALRYGDLSPGYGTLEEEVRTAPASVLELITGEPSAIAVRAGAGDLSYDRLVSWSDAIAARLYSEGIGAGCVVGVLTERGPELLPAMLGVLKAGAAFLPLDANYPVERLSRYVEVAECDLILADARSLEFAASLGAAMEVPADNGAAMAVPPAISADDLAYVLFTSGSTGEPKGVEIQHGALANFLAGIGARLGVTADDQVLAHTTTAFDISLLELLLPLTRGATVVLASREVARDPHKLAQLASWVTVAQATPSLWRLLLDTEWTPHSGLTVFSGGEALPPATAKRLLTSARGLWNLYGPTEATIWVSTHKVESVGGFLPLGDPLPGVDMHVLDEAFSPAETGELYLSGTQLARGYINRAERTAEVFLTHPSTGERLYRTGDVVKRHPDGALEWLGRADGQVKVRGNRIETGEIEAALEDLPTISAAVVIAIPFENRGEPRLTAYLIGTDLTKSTLDTHLADRLPDYMIPSNYVIVDSLPLTDNGKVARKQLPTPTRDTILRSTTPDPTNTAHPTPTTQVANSQPTTTPPAVAQSADLSPPAASQPTAAAPQATSFPASTVPTSTTSQATSPVATLPASTTLQAVPPAATPLTSQPTVTTPPTAAQPSTTDLPTTPATAPTTSATPVPAAVSPTPAAEQPPPLPGGRPLGQSIATAESEQESSTGARTDLPEVICRVFAAVLKTDVFEAGDNFFDLGGDSANVTIAATNLSRELGIEVSPPSIFATGTPAKLARMLGHVPAAPQVSGPPPPGYVDAAERRTVEVAVVDRPERGGDELAVVGMACRFPGASTPDEFWANLAQGVSSIGAAPEGHRGWGHLWTDADEIPAGWVDGVEYFDPKRFGLTDREARRLDPLQRMLLSVTDEAMESAGHDAVSLGANTGVYIGTIASDFPDLVAGSVGHADPHVATGTALSLLANRVSHAFDWSGASFAIDTACSSSLVALHQAALALRAGEIDAAVIGAANVVLTPYKSRSFVRSGMLSPTGVCRTFDHGADGYVRGEGCGVLIVKRLADAERDGDPVLAVVRGTAVNHTGGSAGFLTAPSAVAQEAVVKRALALSGIDGSGVGYIEAHGTGTQLGDLIELEALRASLAGADHGSVAIGSVKTNIGHLEPAAGIAGLIKAVLALQAEQIPPSLNLDTPNKAFRFEESPLFVPDRLVPWTGPKVAGVSSFGFGGANAHAVLEAAPRKISEVEGPFLLTLSAGSAQGLRTLADRLVKLLRAPYCPPLAALCAASQERPLGEHRLACVVDTVEQLDDKLMLFLARVDGARLHLGTAGDKRTALAPLPEKPARELLEDVARRFTQGADLPARPRGAGVRFPTAPHEERYLWLEPARPATPRRGWDELFEADEHIVLGKPTLPGAAYPSRVARVLGRDRFGVRDLTFRAAVLTPTTLTGDLDASSVVFRDGSGAVVCTAKVDDNVTIDALVPPATEAGFAPVDLAELYGTFERGGLAYGPGYRCLTALAASGGHATGTVHADTTHGVVDARLLDGAFQVALTACGAQGLYVPFAIERMRVHGPVPSTARVYARQARPAAPGAALITAHLVIMDGSIPVVEVHGATWKRVTPASGLDTSTASAPTTATPPHPLATIPTTPLTPALASANGHPNGNGNGNGQATGSGASAVAAPHAHPLAPPPAPPAPPTTIPVQTTSFVQAVPVVQTASPVQTTPVVGAPPAMPGVGAAAGLVDAVAEWVANALETDLDSLELDRPLEEQGLDSMLAVSLAQDIRAKLGVEIPVTLVLEVGTVEALVEELRENYGVTGAPAAAGAHPFPAEVAPAAPISSADSGPALLPAAGAPPTAHTPPTDESPTHHTGLQPVTTHHIAEPVAHQTDAHPLTQSTSGPVVPGHDIAIIGFDGVFPNADDPDELWQLVLNGEDALTEVPEDRWDLSAYYSDDASPGTVYLRRAGFIDDLTGFDAGFFRIAPSEAQWIDPQQRHLIMSAWRAMEDAGVSGRIAGRKVGVFVGASYQHYRDQVVGDVVQTAAGLGNHNAILANRVSYFLDLAGPSMTIDTLCSSSLVALHTAVRSLREGECEQAVVSGVHMALSPQYFQLGSRLRSFSPSGASRAFDSRADGFVPGEGVVTVILKPLAEALRDGDRVHAVVKGTAVNHGGRTSGLTVPSSAAQQSVISSAIADAGIDPATIGLMEAHGTGTSLGDPIEIEGLTKAWRKHTDRTQFCAIGSLKSNIGHLEPAAGLAGLVKVVLAMRHRKIPPTAHVIRPNDHIQFETTPFYLSDRVTDWHAPAGHPRRAAVSAFGMGGVNAHVVLEEPPTPAPRAELAQDSTIVRVSGATEEAVRALAAAYAAKVPTESSLDDFAFTANVGRAEHRFRAAARGSSAEELAKDLAAIADGSAPVAKQANRRPPVAFLFTGQGSQYPDMGRGLYLTEPVFREALDECSQLLGRDLVDLLYGDSRDQLVHTANAQPAIVSVQVAITRLLASWGVTPDLVAGHSVGELAAAHAAGAISLPDLLALTAHRGRLMQAQPTDGGMAVVYADAPTVHAELAAHPGVEVAAYNSPKNTTVSGPSAALEGYLSATAHRTTRLTVSHAFHSAMMEGALPGFIAVAERVAFGVPSIPIASTLTGTWHTAESIVDPHAWASAIRMPVRFTDAVAALHAAGARTFWEIGPHPVLTPLAQSSLPADSRYLHVLRRNQPDQRTLHTNLADLYGRTGAALDWTAAHRGRDHRTTTIPTYPFDKRPLVAPPVQEAIAAREPTGTHPLFDHNYQRLSEGLQ
ncbi:amino acid adenylation domain-containing protein [Actinokineospora guangxiensis]|uniref:Amino acid adenylation domain-containing protein n=1 Tax=Actinokineospora guangxiensis TaxID=1490288 RepID=A0ABW0ELB0_9PSEU